MGEAMRTVIHSQMTLGEVDIAKIKLDPKSRDDIPQLLHDPFAKSFVPL